MKFVVNRVHSDSGYFNKNIQGLEVVVGDLSSIVIISQSHEGWACGNVIFPNGNGVSNNTVFNRKICAVFEFTISEIDDEGYLM